MRSWGFAAAIAATLAGLVVLFLACGPNQTSSFCEGSSCGADASTGDGFRSEAGGSPQRLPRPSRGSSFSSWPAGRTRRRPSAKARPAEPTQAPATASDRKLGVRRSDCRDPRGARRSLPGLRAEPDVVLLRRLVLRSRRKHRRRLQIGSWGFAAAIAATLAGLVVLFLACGPNQTSSFCEGSSCGADASTGDGF